MERTRIFSVDCRWLSILLDIPIFYRENTPHWQRYHKKDMALTGISSLLPISTRPWNVEEELVEYWKFVWGAHPVR
jgi:hypothetical protein